MCYCWLCSDFILPECWIVLYLKNETQKTIKKKLAHVTLWLNNNNWSFMWTGSCVLAPVVWIQSCPGIGGTGSRTTNPNWSKKSICTFMFVRFIKTCCVITVVFNWSQILHTWTQRFEGWGTSARPLSCAPDSDAPPIRKHSGCRCSSGSCHSFFFIILHFLLQKRVYENQKMVRVCSAARVPLFSLMLPATKLGLNWWYVISRDVVEAYPQLLGNCQKFLRKVFLFGWKKWWGKAVTSRLFPPLFWWVTLNIFNFRVWKRG